MMHIKKYLARQCNDDASLKKLQEKNFWEFLYDLGLYDSKATSWSDVKYQQLAKVKYLNAIRTEITGSAGIFIQRDTTDMFINNYNPTLMLILKSNHDIQIVTDRFACVNYVTGYLIKSGAGFSRTVKEIEKNYIDLPNIEIVKKIGNAIDKEREVSIQEIIYRLLGLPMSKFSAKVKFINTSHPEHRDGLMKGNLDDLGAEEDVYHMSCHQYYENRPLNEEYDSTD